MQEGQTLKMIALPIKKSQDESIDRVFRLPAKKYKVQNLKEYRRQQKKGSDKSAYAEEKASMKALSEVKSLMQDLAKQIQELTKVTSGNTAMRQQQRPIRGRNVVCYGCGVLGHIVCDCPQK